MENRKNETSSEQKREKQEMIEKINANFQDDRPMNTKFIDV